MVGEINWLDREYFIMWYWLSLLNEWMNYTIYIPSMKFEGQAQGKGIFDRVGYVSFVQRQQLDNNVVNYSIFVEWEFGVF